jgi:hypothetical protein
MRPSQDQSRRPMSIVFLGDYADDASVDPCPVHNVLDPGFARFEITLLPMLGLDREAAEVAETIVIDRHDLAGYLAFQERRRGFFSRHGANLRGRNFARVTSIGDDQTFGQVEISLQHRMPPARRRRYSNAPLEPGQEPLLRMEQVACGLERDLILECPKDLAPGKGLRRRGDFGRFPFSNLDRRRRRSRRSADQRQLTNGESIGANALTRRRQIHRKQARIRARALRHRNQRHIAAWTSDGVRIRRGEPVSPALAAERRRSVRKTARKTLSIGVRPAVVGGPKCN